MFTKLRPDTNNTWGSKIKVSNIKFLSVGYMHIVTFTQIVEHILLNCMHLDMANNRTMFVEKYNQKTGWPLRGDDSLYQNNNMYTWSNILNLCTMPDIFANEF